MARSEFPLKRYWVACILGERETPSRSASRCRRYRRRFPLVPNPTPWLGRRISGGTTIYAESRGGECSTLSSRSSWHAPGITKAISLWRLLPRVFRGNSRCRLHARPSQSETLAVKELRPNRSFERDAPTSAFVFPLHIVGRAPQLGR